MSTNSSRNTFFIEIIIVILFFSISSAVILNFFVSAYNEAQNSYDINNAVIRAQNAAESFQSNPAVFFDEHSYYEMNQKDYVTEYYFGFDNDFNKTNDEPVYIMSVVTENQDNFKTAFITVMRSKDKLRLFELQTGKFIEMGR